MVSSLALGFEFGTWFGVWHLVSSLALKKGRTFVKGRKGKGRTFVKARKRKGCTFVKERKGKGRTFVKARKRKGRTFVKERKGIVRLKPLEAP